MMEMPYIDPDPMMDELHATRARISAQAAAVAAAHPGDPEAVDRWRHEQAEKAAASAGYKLVQSTDHPHTYRLVRQED